MFLYLQLSSVMRTVEVEVWTNGYDATRVDTSLAPLQQMKSTITDQTETGGGCIINYLVATLYVESIGSFSKRVCLIEIPQVAPEIGVVHYPLLVTLRVNGSMSSTANSTELDNIQGYPLKSCFTLCANVLKHNQLRDLTVIVVKLLNYNNTSY